MQSIDENSLLLMLTPCGNEHARQLPTSPEEKSDAWEHFAIGPYVTFLISTFNRREVLLKTLAELHEIDLHCGLITEMIVVDNASTDGTADSVSNEFPGVRLIRLDTNEGACAKNHGLSVAAGEFVIFLDDDSFPDVGSVRRMVELFYAEPRLGAAIFNVTLPDGSCECSAYPRVVIGCGTGFRRSALKDVGGLPTDFFMQAEEYDLSLRLLDRRWLIRRFDDLHVQHLKTPTARVPTRTTRLDVRNNLMVVTRYFPRQWIVPFAMDWTRRYAWIASSKGYQHLWAVLVGIVQGLWMSLRPSHRRPMGLAAFEEFAMVVTIRRRLDLAVRSGHIRSILLIDVGKNILPFWLATKASGLHVVAIADPRLAKAGRRYHGVPVVTDEEAAAMKFDAAVVANVSPIHARLRSQTWRKLQKRPVIDLFEQASPLRKAA